MSVKSKRSRKLIRAWLLRNDKSVTRVAQIAGVDLSLVSRTMNNENNNRRVLRTLVSLGCPARLLALPLDMQTEKAA